ncbi:hypothetical protein [Luteimonas notoginsengisoli]|jgi:hypothetical protein|uniref:Uncharacterized protein n=1 Tax=Luteimonas notoginsengisoli TaxID=1578200 RepID=A0ABV7UQX9_9GAMM
MPDFTSRPADPPAGWHEAFAALPLEGAPADGWAAVARRLDARRLDKRRGIPRWLPLAAAAALALAVVPAWLPQPADNAPSSIPTRAAMTAQTPDADAGPVPATATLEHLYAESARLESLLQYARENRVASGAAAMMAAELDARLGTIDAALMQPGLDRSRQRQLWSKRVQLLRAFASFESTRRWLAANGERYDGALVRVD